MIETARPLSPQPGTKPRRRSYSRYLWAILTFSLLLFAGLCVYIRGFRLPAPTGPFLVGTTILDLTDTARHDPFSTSPSARRELVVQLWYPAAPSGNSLAPYMRWREAGLSRFYAPLLRTHSRSDAPVADTRTPFPVLLFNHRWGGQRTQNTVLAEDLASHGYVVVSIDHPGNSARVQLANGTVVRSHPALEGPKGPRATADEQIAFWNSSLELWAADNRFVLDQLTAKSFNPLDPFHARLDTAHAGAFGHSFGGAVALALCGPGSGSGAGTSDPRIQAAANLDGWTFGGLRDRTAAQPVLLFYEGISQSREKQLTTLPRPGPAKDQLDRADFASTEASLRSYGGYRLFVAGTQHLDFSDEPLLPPFRRTAYTGPTPPHEVNAILSQTLLQFFGHTLRQQSAPLLSGPTPPFPELTIERWDAPVPPANPR